MVRTDNREKLRNQLEEHLARWDGEWPGNYWAEVDFPVDGETTTLQFHFGSFNATNLDEDRRARFKNIIDEESLEIHSESDLAITTTDGTKDVEEAVNITDRILEEVYGVDYDDFEDIREVEH